MTEEFDSAHERLEHVVEGRRDKKSTKRTAIIIAVMAAVLALTEFGEKDAQANYLSGQVEVSNIWAHYQAKSVRRAVLSAEADLLEDLPAASSPAMQKKIADARANAARMRSDVGNDGMEQLMSRARALERERDHEKRRKNVLETASGGLQIAIVLASISVVVEAPGFMLASVLLGLASAIYAIVGAFAPL